MQVNRHSITNNSQLTTNWLSLESDFSGREVEYDWAGGGGEGKTLKQNKLSK